MAAPLQQMPSKVTSMGKGKKIHSLCSILFPPCIVIPVRANVSPENTVRSYLEQMMNSGNDRP